MVRVGVYCFVLAVTITSYALNWASILNPAWITFRTPAEFPISLTTSYGLFQRCDTTRLPFSDDQSTTCRRFPSRSLDCSSKPGDGKHVLSPWGTQAMTSVESMPMGWDRVEAAQARARLGKSRNGDDGGEDDEEEVWTFCDSWITAGYLAHLGLLFGTTAIFATLLVIISNSRQKRHDGWKLVGSLMALHAASLIVTFSLVVHEFGHDNRFYLGCKLDKSFTMATAAWCLEVLAIVALLAAALLGEDGDGDGYRQILDDED